MKGMTALVIANNAAKTIERSIGSALPEVDEVLVLDNASSDGTVACITNMNDKRIRLIKQRNMLVEGAAKTLCLEACRTPYASWLGSCDEFLPGRVEKLQSYLEQGFDWVFDNMEIFSEERNIKIGRTIYPDFVRDRDGIAYQFARNYLMGEGTPLVNVERALNVGYKPLKNVAGYDHFLRAVISGGAIKIHDTVTYRKYIANSLSEFEKSLQFKEAQTVLKNIGFSAIDKHLEATHLTESQKYEIKLFYLSNTESWIELRDLLSHKPGCDTPYFKWLVTFMEGVAEYMLGDIQHCLESTRASLHIQRRPESLNNLAVCQALSGHDYLPLLDEALIKSPMYLDAMYNREQTEKRITLVPLRGFDIPEFIGSPGLN